MDLMGAEVATAAMGATHFTKFRSAGHHYGRRHDQIIPSWPRIPFTGRPQVWMTPFFPNRAAAGQDPSGATFRLPFQNVLTGNHIAQWTETVVGQ